MWLLDLLYISYFPLGCSRAFLFLYALEVYKNKYNYNYIYKHIDKYNYNGIMEV